MAKLFNIVTFNFQRTAGKLSPACYHQSNKMVRSLSQWPQLKTLQYNKIESKLSHVKYSQRTYATESNDKNNDDEKNEKVPVLPDLMELPITFYFTGGSVWDLAKVWFATTFRMPRVDKNFNMTEFIEGANTAMVVVSQRLAAQEYDQLIGLITPDALNILRTNIDRMTPEQIERISINKENIVNTFAINFVINTDEVYKPPRYTVQISVIALLRRPVKGQENVDDEETQPATPFAKDQHSIAVYRFMKCYKKDSDEDWTVDFLNHIEKDDYMDKLKAGIRKFK